MFSGSRLLAHVAIVWFIVCCSILLPFGFAFGSDEVNISIHADLGYQGGHNTWSLKLTEYEPSIDAPVTVESELEWPLDFVLAGVEAVAEGKRWALGLLLQTNLTDPSGEMVDSDWLSAESVAFPRTKFSYTESSTEAFAFIADLRGLYRVYSWGESSKKLFLKVLGGYRHEYYELDAYGAVGWQLDDDGDRSYFRISESVHGISYEVNHLLPYIGIGIRGVVSERFFIDSALRFFGLFSIDHDNHLVRKKELDARGYGYGLGFEVQPRFLLSGLSTNRFSFALGLDLNVEYLHAPWGTLEQSFYADDPGTPEDERNIGIPASDFSLNSLVYGAMAVGTISF